MSKSNLAIIINSDDKTLDDIFNYIKENLAISGGRIVYYDIADVYDKKYFIKEKKLWPMIHSK